MQNSVIIPDSFRGNKVGKAKDYTVVVGTKLRLQHIASTQEITASKIVPHPKYKLDTIANDLAIIKLSRSIKIDFKNTDILQIATSRPNAHTPCITMGWGLLYEVTMVYHLTNHHTILIIPNPYGPCYYIPYSVF